jgi:nucleoside-diphosphate-sugar epimerase
MTSPAPGPHILVFGGSGLIGHFVAIDLARRGYGVVAAQKFGLSRSRGFMPHSRSRPQGARML